MIGVPSYPRSQPSCHERTVDRDDGGRIGPAGEGRSSQRVMGQTIDGDRDLARPGDRSSPAWQTTGGLSKGSLLAMPELNPEEQMLNLLNNDQVAVAAAVSAHDLHRRYGDGDAAVDALRGVTLDVPSGRFVAVMGPSGSGKSTLMHLLAGLDRPTSGSVAIGGLDLADLDDDALTKLRRDRVGFIFQSFNLVPTLSAEENVVLPERLAGRKADAAWVDSVLERVGLAERRTHRPAQLSGGQQQRVAVARALVSAPAVLFADEPTGNLDSASGAQVLNLMREAVDRDGQTIVMVTHDLRAAAIADEVVVLADGEIVRRLDAPSEELDRRDDARGGGMIRLALSDLRGHRLRTILSVIAVTLGVALVTGALTLTGSMTKAADSLSTAAYGGVDAAVTAQSTVDTTDNDTVVTQPTLAGLAAGPRAGRPAGRDRRRRGPGRGQDGRLRRRDRRRGAVLRRRLRLRQARGVEAHAVPPRQRATGRPVRATS